MKSITIKGQVRESVGKKSTKTLRNAEQVPCVVYGGETSVHFAAPSKSFKHLVYTADAVIANIELQGQEPIKAVIKDIQFHPLTDIILHIDFYQLFEDKKITMDIPVILTGSSQGVLSGGSLRHTMRKLKVKALPSKLPDTITADITELNIGDKLTVAEIKNDNYEIMHPDNVVVVQIKMSRNASTSDDVAEETATEEDSTKEAATE